MRQHRPQTRSHLFIGQQVVGLSGNGEVRRTVFRRMGAFDESEAWRLYRGYLSQFDRVGWWTRNDGARRWLQRH